MPRALNRVVHCSVCLQVAAWTASACCVLLVCSAAAAPCLQRTASANAAGGLASIIGRFGGWTLALDGGKAPQNGYREGPLRCSVGSPVGLQVGSSEGRGIGAGQQVPGTLRQPHGRSTGGPPTELPQSSHQAPINRPQHRGTSQGVRARSGRRKEVGERARVSAAQRWLPWVRSLGSGNSVQSTPLQVAASQSQGETPVPWHIPRPSHCPWPMAGSRRVRAKPRPSTLWACQGAVTIVSRQAPPRSAGTLLAPCSSLPPPSLIADNLAVAPDQPRGKEPGFSAIHHIVYDEFFRLHVQGFLFLALGFSGFRYRCRRRSVSSPPPWRGEFKQYCCVPSFLIVAAIQMPASLHLCPKSPICLMPLLFVFLLCLPATRKSCG